MFQKFTHRIYSLMMIGACLSMVTAFLTIGLGVIAREAAWNIQGLDAYAGYSIAAALFLALPGTFKRGEHIRVTLLIQKMSPRVQRWLEYWCLSVGALLSLYVAAFAVRIVWVSYATHDVSQGADATPLWVPQIFMAIGCVGFALSVIDALWAHVTEQPFFEAPANGAARVE